MKKRFRHVVFILFIFLFSQIGLFSLLAEEKLKPPGVLKNVVHIKYKYESYLLLLKTLPMYNATVIFNAQVIGNCPIGFILKSESSAFLNFELEDKREESVSVDLVTCNDLTGWIKNDHSDVEEKSDRELLERNKKKIPVARQMSLEIGGTYTNKEIYELYIGKDPKLDYALEMNLSGGSEYIYFENYHRLGNGIWEASGKEGTVVLTKMGKKLKIVVKKDLNGKLKRFHNKVFGPYQCCG